MRAVTIRSIAKLAHVQYTYLQLLLGRWFRLIKGGRLGHVTIISVERLVGEGLVSELVLARLSSHGHESVLLWL